MNDPSENTRTETSTACVSLIMKHSIYAYTRRLATMRHDYDARISLLSILNTSPLLQPIYLFAASPLCLRLASLEGSLRLLILCIAPRFSHTPTTLCSVSCLFALVVFCMHVMPCCDTPIQAAICFLCSSFLGAIGQNGLGLAWLGGQSVGRLDPGWMGLSGLGWLQRLLRMRGFCFDCICCDIFCMFRKLLLHS